MRNVAITYRLGFSTIPVLNNIDAIEDFDVIVLTGGADISPSLYGGDPKLCGQIQYWRDEFEIKVYERAKNLGKKLFGVCRGHQLINVLEGGKLFEDMRAYELPYHPGNHGLDIIHDVPFRKHIPNMVNSMHHQAVSSTPLTVWGTFGGADGVIEGTIGKNILTTQFHPEFDPACNSFLDWVFNEWEG